MLWSLQSEGAYASRIGTMMPEICEATSIHFPFIHHRAPYLMGDVFITFFLLLVNDQYLKLNR
ncbi:hypothetical protein WR06_17575 [Escherichia coli]|nr:hypothetical protein WR06_17575 [Escherichia coli]